jgi:hypothetical protein
VQTRVALGLGSVIEYVAGIGYGIDMSEVEARGFALALSLLHRIRALAASDAARGSKEG